MPVATAKFNCSPVTHLLPFTCDINWWWCNYVYTSLLLPGGVAVRFSWQTDMTRHRKHSEFYGVACHFRHHCLQAKEIPSRLVILNVQGKKKRGKEEITTASSISSAGSCFKASSFNTETTDEGLTTWNISWTQFVIAEIQFEFDNEDTDTCVVLFFFPQ